MFVIPAIDLRGGSCVRLEQGDFARDTRYADDPVAVAQEFEAYGATWLHLVDLDGARSGTPAHLALLRAIAQQTSLQIEFGGGIRSLNAVADALDHGAARVVLGTAALEQPDLVTEACGEYGERIVVGLDARNGRVAVRGWLETSSTQAVDLASRVVDAGCIRLIYTDIATDGMLRGPNLEGLRILLATVAVPVIASGGVATEDDLLALAQAGAEAAIVGKALYTGSLPLAVLREWQEGHPQC
jgi:phosphoribosylformimino-5-aminoimidazole carboxamide ribotide isomerase